MQPTLPLFIRFPRLTDTLPHVPLGNLPTPVGPLPGLSAKFCRNDLFVKRDDLSGILYGGNKVRKLEFLLADARTSGARRIITSGAAGSNHALATALYARTSGFDVTLMLFEQAPQPAIGPNLLADFASGAEMLHDTTYSRHLEHLRDVRLRYEHDDGVAPYIIPPGGSSALGAVGFVNAAFELRDQIAGGLLPEPAAIFVAWGTMGSVVGLQLGCRAAGLHSRVCAIRVVPDPVANIQKCRTLFDATCRLLSENDPTFPTISFDDNPVITNDRFFGEGYGLSTPEGLSAIEAFRTSTDISLDPVYTGKTAAAFLNEARTSTNTNGPLLYWHTKNSRLLPDESMTVDFHDLPPDFHRYFTDPR